MGVNTDGEETNLETSLWDDNQTTEFLEMEHETGPRRSKNNFLLNDECTGKIQDQKLAQPKSPDKPAHDPTQDQLEAVDVVITRTRNNEANKSGLPKSSGHQTWDSGFDPPFLRTLNSVKTSAELSEDGGSTWHRLLGEEIGQSRKCSKPIITRRDPSIQRASLESNSTSKSTRSPVAHQNFYGKQYISYITTSSVNKSKHRNTRTGGPPPVLMILKTFLRLFLASASLAFLLAGCTVHVAGNGLKEKQTTESWQMEHETEHAWSTNNFLFDVECARGIQDPKLMGATDNSLITPKEDMSSQNTSVVSISEQTTSQQDNTDGGDIVLSNNSYRQKEMLNSKPASFTTHSSKSDDMCTQLKECRLQTLDITKVLDNDSINS